MADPDYSAARWVKSSRSEHQGQCVELAAVDGRFGVRDSKRGEHGPVLTFPPGAFNGLLTGIKTPG